MQETLDKITRSKSQSTITIAHRLSTIRNADRIAVILDRKVREVGTHDELMAIPDGRYRRLQAFQDLDRDERLAPTKKLGDYSALMDKKESKGEQGEAQDNQIFEVDKVKVKMNASRVRLLAKDDRGLFLIGGIGALLVGLVFPSWGVSYKIFNYFKGYCAALSKRNSPELCFVSSHAVGCAGYLCVRHRSFVPSCVAVLG